jgi:hypothetical protein
MMRIVKQVIVLVVFSLLHIPTGVAQNWIPMDKGIDCTNITAEVKNIVVDSVKDKLYISGSFYNDGWCSPLRGVAQWTGVKWSAVGSGVQGNDYKLGMTMFRDTLYLSGNFNDTNTNEYLAKWNGTYWDTIPNSPEGVLTFAQKGGVLYMGRAFDYEIWDSTFLAGKYDGSQFSRIVPPCTGSSGFIFSMAFYQNILYVGGYFDMFPCKALAGLGKWDGSDLQAVSPDFPVSYCFIQAMTEYKGELYIGGYFSQANGYAGNNIMKWNGTSFSEVGGGISGRVRCMKVYNDKLYVGGDFTQAGGVASNYVAMWDGTNWNSLTTDTFTGPEIQVEAINVYHDSLIIGGLFTSINGDTACRRIAKYNHALPGIEQHDQNDLMIIYPNPATNQITIEFSSSSNTLLEIKNVLGQAMYSETIENVLGKQSKNIDVSAFSNGIYFVRLRNEKGSVNKKFIKQ